MSDYKVRATCHAQQAALTKNKNIRIQPTKTTSAGQKKFQGGKIMSNSLKRFIKQECACWTGEPEEECLGVDVFGNPFRKPGKCWVMESKPCKHFKDCVLGPEDYKYPLLCFLKDSAFEKRVRKQYKKIDHTVVEADARRCECGALLRARQRYCDNCTKKRRLKTRREYQRKFRKMSRSNVVQLTKMANS